jgi:hypothetical protein
MDQKIFLHFESKNITNISLNQFCFEILIIPNGFNLSFRERIIWSFIHARLKLIKVHDEVTFFFLWASKQEARVKTWGFVWEKKIVSSLTLLLSAWIITSSFIRNVMILVKKFFYIFRTPFINLSCLLAWLEGIVKGM